MPGVPRVFIVVLVFGAGFSCTRSEPSGRGSQRIGAESSSVRVVADGGPAVESAERDPAMTVPLLQPPALSPKEFFRRESFEAAVVSELGSSLGLSEAEREELGRIIEGLFAELGDNDPAELLPIERAALRRSTAESLLASAALLFEADRSERWVEEVPRLRSVLVESESVVELPTLTSGFEDRLLSSWRHTFALDLEQTEEAEALVAEYAGGAIALLDGVDPEAQPDWTDPRVTFGWPVEPQLFELQTRYERELLADLHAFQQERLMEASPTRFRFMNR